MAKNPGVNMLQRGKGGPGAPSSKSAATVTADAPKKRTSPGQFAKEVRQEIRKISWTSWRETWITSIMVFIMVVISAIFFLVVDFGLGFLIQQILKLAN